MKSTAALIACFILFVRIASSQYVNIPDPGFKTWILANVPHSASPIEITPAEAAAYTGQINVINLSIYDLTGIEAFTNITYIDCTNNNLASLDISHNTMITDLLCGANSLTSLDVSMNYNLQYLTCSYNQISDLDVHSNPLLRVLFCSANYLTTLDVSSNPALIILICSNNSITNLELSANPLLSTIYCGYNLLTSLNIKNGHNSNVNNNGFEALTNPNLTCIDVDDVPYCSANWLNIDPGVSFSFSCSGVAVNEILNKNKMVVKPNPVQTITTITFPDKLNGSSLTLYNSLGQLVLMTNGISGKEFILNAEKLPDGVYFIRVVTNSIVGSTEKLVLAK